MKKLINSWTKTEYQIDPETGKPLKDKIILTEIFSIYRIGDREIAEVETISDDLYVNVSGELNSTNAKLFIETADTDGGITKKEYADLVRASIGAKVDEDKLKTAVFKAAYKIQRLGKYPSLFYSPEWVQVAVEIYSSL